MKKLLLIVAGSLIYSMSYCWGFFGHEKINHYAVFLLPPDMMVLFKPNIDFLQEHSVDPDKRRYAVAEEGPRHYIDIDHYGFYPYNNLPRKWEDAKKAFTEDTLLRYGIVPWHVEQMLFRLTRAFREKDFVHIMKYSAEIGHYIADAHVPLHANSNHNGQLTNQRGIHGFWESRVPELLAEKNFDFYIGKAAYIPNPLSKIWEVVLESAIAADSVLRAEKELTELFAGDKKFAFEERNGQVVRQYSSDFTQAFDKRLSGMVERRMRQAIFMVASFWYTAWVNAGQPNLKELAGRTFTEAERLEFDTLNSHWKSASQMIGRQEE